MKIQCYEDVVFELDKFLKSDECKTLDDVKKKFKNDLAELYDVQEDKEIEKILDQEIAVHKAHWYEQDTESDASGQYDCDGTPYNKN
jgi:hypothetical protein|tara:strand:+ start:291 stop:551 length:261 start_codon:yes stop_codon:yes gene_type:complete